MMSTNEMITQDPHEKQDTCTCTAFILHFGLDNLTTLQCHIRTCLYYWGINTQSSIKTVHNDQQWTTAIDEQSAQLRTPVHQGSQVSGSHVSVHYTTGGQHHIII